MYSSTGAVRRAVETIQAPRITSASFDRFRTAERHVLFTRHDSREPRSPLKIALPTGAFIGGCEPRAREVVVVKDVNGGFIGTALEIHLRRAGISRLMVAGFFTNMCVEATVRHGGNLGFDHGAPDCRSAAAVRGARDLSAARLGESLRR